MFGKVEYIVHHPQFHPLHPTQAVECIHEAAKLIYGAINVKQAPPFNEANNLGCKLYDDKDMDLNHWHQMDLIQINLLWLKSLLIYEHALSFIEQDISDDERFEVAKIHYHVTEIEKLNIDCILNNRKRILLSVMDMQVILWKKSDALWKM